MRYIGYVLRYVLVAGGFYAMVPSKELGSFACRVLTRQPWERLIAWFGPPNDPDFPSDSSRYSVSQCLGARRRRSSAVKFTGPDYSLGAYLYLWCQAVGIKSSSITRLANVFDHQIRTRAMSQTNASTQSFFTDADFDEV